MLLIIRHVVVIQDHFQFLFRRRLLVLEPPKLHAFNSSDDFDIGSGVGRLEIQKPRRLVFAQVVADRLISHINPLRQRLRVHHQQSRIGILHADLIDDVLVLLKAQILSLRDFIQEFDFVIPGLGPGALDDGCCLEVLQGGADLRGMSLRHLGDVVVAGLHHAIWLLQFLQCQEHRAHRRLAGVLGHQKPVLGA